MNHLETPKGRQVHSVPHNITEEPFGLSHPKFCFQLLIFFNKTVRQVFLSPRGSFCAQLCLVHVQCMAHLQQLRPQRHPGYRDASLFFTQHSCAAHSASSRRPATVKVTAAQPWFSDTAGDLDYPEHLFKSEVPTLYLLHLNP